MSVSPMENRRNVRQLDLYSTRDKAIEVIVPTGVTVLMVPEHS